MRVVKTMDAPPQPMGEYGVPGFVLREIFTAATGAPTFALRHFEVAVGCAAHSHFHPWEHEVYILEGEGEIVGEEGATPFRAGDSCYTAPKRVASVPQHRHGAPPLPLRHPEPALRRQRDADP